MTKDLQDIILDAIQTDDSYSLTNEYRLIKKYKSNKTAAATLDYVFIQLCGYSLKTLLEERFKDEPE